jgi:hypothetical protein
MDDIDTPIVDDIRNLFRKNRASSPQKNFDVNSQLVLQSNCKCTEATHIEPCASRSARTTVAPSLIGSSAVTDNI